MIEKALRAVLVFFLPIVQACGQAHQQSKEKLEIIQQAESNTTVLNNAAGLVPLKNLEEKKIVSIDFGFAHSTDFDSLLNKYAPVDKIKSVSYNNNLPGLDDDIKFYNLIIAVLPDSALQKAEIIDFLKNIQPRKQMIVAVFGEGKFLQYIDEIEAPVVWCHPKTAEAAGFVAQVIFGGRGVQNKLPEDFSAKYVKDLGFDTFPFRLAYTVPEELGLNSNDFTEIDKIAQKAIKEQATPGAVLLVAIDGKVVFNKAYGYHTYEKETPARVDDIYDLASITKIAATTIASMKLYEEGKLDLDAPLSKYIARTKNTPKANIKVKDVLLHQAGFIPYIPFYQDLKPNQFSRDSTQDFSVKVADSFYISKDYYRDVMWKKMLDAPLRTPGKYVYSDLSMYYMKEILENITGEALPQYLNHSFYNSLGVNTMVFNPRNKFNKEQIVPTEQDEYFRKTLLWGYVHDQGAAMAGGIAGHAGLFANATDLAVLSQMLLNKGTYGGIEYFKPQTVDLFTAKQSDLSRRGLGFDRRDSDPSKKYPSEYASELTFGHTGYTGTCLWIDPAQHLIYIFLSNRVHPKVTNKLLSMNIRPEIQDVIYKAIEKRKQ